MNNAYEMFSLGLRFSHRALLRNLDQFAKLSLDENGLVLDGSDGRQAVSRQRTAQYIQWYSDFLDVHHRGEDEHIFPALRKHSAGRTTDIAHLDTWQREHERIYRLSQDLSTASRGLEGGGARALESAQRLAGELKQSLLPHLQAEEEVLTPAHLREMIPENELERAQRSIPRSQGIDAVRMAQFFVHSLEPSEQRALLGETPWFFRKLVLKVLGARLTRRFGGLMPVREVYV